MEHEQQFMGPPGEGDDALSDQAAISQRMSPKHSADRLRALAAATADLLWFVAERQEAQEDNAAWLAFTGQASESMWSWLAAVHVEDQQRIKEACTAMATGADAEEIIECRIRRYDGQFRVFRVRLLPLREPDGELYELMCVGTDITDEQQKGRALAERVTLLEAVFEHMDDAVYVYDTLGQPIYVNTAGRELFAGEYLPGMPFSIDPGGIHVCAYDEQENLLPSERWPLVRVFQGEELNPGQLVHIYARKGHEDPRHVHISARAIIDNQGQVLGAVVVCCDVTERYLLEQVERRRAQENDARRAMLQLILDELPYGVYLVRGQDARLVFINRAAAELWGALWQIGQPMQEFLQQQRLAVFKHDGSQEDREQMAAFRVIRSGRPVHDHWVAIRRQDNKSVPVLINAVRLSGELLSLLITDEPEEAANELDVAALVVMQDVTTLHEGEQLKDQFISLIAQELREPLGLVKDFAQTLVQQAVREDSVAFTEWQLEAIRSILNASVYLTELTDDLFDVTRLEAGLLTLQRSSADLVALVRQVVARLQDSTSRHTLMIFTSLERLFVSVDPVRIEQVLSHLIGNAIKYSPQGGPIEITLRKDVRANDVLISIRDYGIGIPQPSQVDIFDRFTRAANARAYGIAGTGLGLYLCRELVERHGGRLWFGATEGRGSTFFITLPAESS
ncbi:PAS domain-containing sensor histidine kinase [Ktedonosporobacter rubrisoli]|nr:ATP-binding protein [Ktedonosporobacter rubrisoli]